MNILKALDFRKLERLVWAKFGKTTDVLCVVNYIHHVEINYVGLNFLMRFQLKHLLEGTIIKGITNYMKRLKKLFKKLLAKLSSRDTLRDKLVEMYGEEAGDAYDKINAGMPMGGLIETIIFLRMVEDAKKALGEE